LLPADGEGSIERRGIEHQSNPFADQSIMVPYALGQVNQGARSVEKDRFNHGSLVGVMEN
jgi:hypothetical protein